VVSVTDPYGRILGFLDRSRYFSIILSCTHEAEWTPFQIHYFFFFLVVPGIEPGSPDLYPRTLTTRPQRRSLSIYTIFNLCFPPNKGFKLKIREYYGLLGCDAVHSCRN
jgi:hypothetical protein